MQAFRILGIDPGIARMGYGIVEVTGNHITPIAYGCIETPANTSVASRLQMIYDELGGIIRQHQPNHMAVEELFFSRNVTNAFAVGQARGVALLSGVQANMEISEYTPMQVKQAVVGYGKAEKLQVQEMVRVLLNLRERPRPDDTADALAVAITHAQTRPILQSVQNKLSNSGTAEQSIRRIRRPIV